MFELVNQYFGAFVAIAVLLLGVTVFIRFKSAKTKRDKVLYNIYSVVVGTFLIMLVGSKLL